jgi:deoxyadenosine/deoxycytidine kinase
MLIAIEGITGIGKSTLQHILAQHYIAELLVQEFEKHPYLAISNDELTKYGLEREIIFLFMAYHQLKNLDDSNRLVISDFVFEKLKVFALTTLSSKELEGVYYPCFNYLCKNLNKPDLIIHLIGSPFFALSNVRQRNRTTESFITHDHLAKLDKAFDSLFKENKDYKIVAIDVEKYNVVHEQNAIQSVIQLIEAELPKLRDYRAH